MPLERGKSRATFSRNVAEMINAGHPRNQALAASYREQRMSMAAGGHVGERKPSMNDSHIKGTAALPKHGEDVKGPVPMHHRAKLGVTNLQENPNGVGKPSTENKIANGSRKTW